MNWIGTGMRWVYICSPFAGDMEKNVAAARRYCRFAYEEGFMPIAPHLYLPQFLDDGNHRERADALDMGKKLMDECSEVWVFGSRISEGMVSEIDYARHWGYTIRYFTENCEEFMRKG